jgi:beta-lactamase class A
LENILQTFVKITAQLTELAAGSSFLITKVVGKQCKTIYGSNNKNDFVPLGSTFKLYVLAALVEVIIAGNLVWKEELAIWEELKSPPSGTMQNKAAGTHYFTILQFAQLMIQISDNMATDHLINLLG